MKHIFNTAKKGIFIVIFLVELHAVTKNQVGYSQDYIYYRYLPDLMLKVLKMFS